jgi:multimeric flavodoxin WrbA
MNIIVLSSSPNHDGLTAACASAAADGARAGGADVVEVRLNDLPIGMWVVLQIISVNVRRAG